jgi:hypothetical protein
VHDLEPAQHALGCGVGVGSWCQRRQVRFAARRDDVLGDIARPGVVRSGPVDAWGEDGDAVLAFEDVAAEAVPGADAAHVGGVGTLDCDEEDVRR